MYFIPEEKIMFDKERTLILSYKVLKKFREASGKYFGRCLAVGFNEEEISQLLHASFSEEDPEITLEDIQGMLHAGRIQEVGDKVLQLVGASFPEQEEGEELKNAKSPTT